MGSLFMFNYIHEVDYILFLYSKLTICYFDNSFPNFKAKKAGISAVNKAIYI